MYDVAVIGAGAAGLTAAIFAAQSGARAVALDGAARIGAKILISGGGRCNVTHDIVSAADFNGRRNAIAKVLRTFTVEQTVEWFGGMGIRLKREETGKLFPVGDRAANVVEALLHAARSAAAEIRTGHRVVGVTPVRGEPEKDAAHYVIATSRGSVEARTVVLATGGRSVPKTGSDGAGYEIARALGHTISATFPALVPLVIDGEHWAKGLRGTSAEAELSITSSTGRVVARERGSLLFTHFGISGPVVLDISRHWVAARSEDSGAQLICNFLPGASFESVEQELLHAAQANPRATVASTFRGRIPERLLDVLTGMAGEPLGRLPRETRRDAVRALTASVLPVSRDRGFDFAEVTAGGVPLEEIDVGTMASRTAAGLYLCGEILDVDGKIGGYNFQWAWASGRLAGLSAARSVK